MFDVENPIGNVLSFLYTYIPSCSIVFWYPINGVFLDIMYLLFSNNEFNKLLSLFDIR